MGIIPNMPSVYRFGGQCKGRLDDQNVSSTSEHLELQVCARNGIVRMVGGNKVIVLIFFYSVGQVDHFQLPYITYQLVDLRCHSRVSSNSRGCSKRGKWIENYSIKRLPGGLIASLQLSQLWFFKRHLQLRSINLFCYNFLQINICGNRRTVDTRTE